LDLPTQTELSDVLPGHALDHAPDRVLGDAELASHASLSPDTCELPNADNLKICEFVQARRFASGFVAQAKLHCVLHVLDLIHPFEIIRSWVQLVAILVIHLRLVVGIFQKRFGHDSMDSGSEGSTSTFPEIIKQVAVVIDARTQVSRSTNPTKIRNFVERMIGDWFPSFPFHFTQFTRPETVGQG
jgi:hypothetical protein